jgi:hypothetical protein
MAEILLKYYKFISDEKGLQGKIKLAQLTKIPSTVAAMEPDSPEIINLFKTSIRTLTGKDAPNY